MDALIFILAMVVLVGVILGYFSAFSSASTAKRVGVLTEYVKRLEAQLVALQTQRSKGEATEKPADAMSNPGAPGAVAPPPNAGHVPPVVAAAPPGQPLGKTHGAPQPAGESLTSLAGAAWLEVTAPSPPAPPATPSGPAAPDAARQPARNRTPPPPRPAFAGLERNLATRAAIWVGAIAIALGCVFLVKYSFDNGILSPPVRVGLGAALGVALVVAGWVLAHPDELLGPGLAAAGIAAVYACLLAAADLYHLIPNGVAFLLLALWTALAVGLSVQLGPLIALVGLVGGFATPGLLHARQPHPGPLFTYLFLLQGGLLVITRRRNWPGVAVLAALAANAWVLLWLAFEPVAAGNYAILGAFELLTTFCVLAAGAAPAAWPANAAAPGKRINPWQALAWVAMLMALIANAWLLRAADFSTLQWGFFFILSAGSLLVARLRPALQQLAWVAATAAFLFLGEWAFAGTGPIVAAHFYFWVGCFAALFALGGYACLWGAKQPAAFAAISLCASAAGVGLVLTYGRFQHRGAWGIVCVALAGLYACGAVPVYRRRALSTGGPAGRGDWAPATLNALAWGVAGFASLALGLFFRDAVLTLALAVELPIVALLISVLDISALPEILVAIGVTVCVRLCANPFIFYYSMASSFFFNWVTLCYAGAAALLAASATIAGHARRPKARAALEAMAALVAAVGLNLLIRHWFHPAGWTFVPAGLTEVAAYVDGALLMAIIFQRLGAARPAFDTAARMLTLLAVFVGGAFLAHFVSPMVTNTVVRTTWGLGQLLPAYMIPAALMLALAAVYRRAQRPALARLLVVAVLVFILLFSSLVVRAAFHPVRFNSGPATTAELYTYSLVWGLIGLALLALGIAIKSPVLRSASLVVMLLTILKVFFVDTSHLHNLLRVLSLVGLGLSLMLLGFLYQRFVFRRPTAPRAAEPPIK